MNFSLKRKKHYVYCGDTDRSMLAEVVKIKGGRPSLKTIAVEPGPVNSAEALGRLIVKAKAAAGKVSIAVPLQQVEVVNLDLPLLPDEAIGRTLPYHLSKAVNRPLSEYIIDWQIIRRSQEQLHITAYLFPTRSFTNLAQELKKNQLTLNFLEADVFAAFAYLDSQKALPAGEAALCAVIWAKSISLAVCCNDKLELSRTVELTRPATQYQQNNTIGSSDAPANGEPPPLPAVTDDTFADLGTNLMFELPTGNEPPPLDSDPSGDSILAGFDLISPDTTQSQAMANPWDDFLQTVNIEIMRTRDYYSSVNKGKRIKAYHILGAELFFAELQALIKQSIDEEIKMFYHNFDTDQDSPTLQVVGLGTGTRF